MKKYLVFATLVFVALFFKSCDDDYNELGANIVGNGHYDFNVHNVASFKAYSNQTGAVQSNNLPVNALGVYTDPFFGTETANFVTQLSLDDEDPSLGYEVEVKDVDSVYLYVPYFYTQTAAATGNEANTYELDSIYGDLSATFDLKIYENGYYLSTYNVDNPSEGQKYYSDATDMNLIESNITGSQLNIASNTAENSAFMFSAAEHIIYETDGNGQYLDYEGNITTSPDEYVVKERKKPGMWITLDDSFRDKILSGDGNLLNNNVFRNYCRGLFFKVTSNGQAAAMAQLNFSSAYIIMQYHSRSAERPSSSSSGYATYEDDFPLEKNEIQLNLTGNTINFFQHTPSTLYTNAIAESNETSGGETVVLKGHNGAAAFIDVFSIEDSTDDLYDLDGNANPNGVHDDLDELRRNNWLINDAIITFTVKNVVQSGETQLSANRIYLYDATNNQVISDYNDTSTYGTDAKRNKYIYGGIIEEEDGVQYYKIRITDYIKSLLNTDDLSNLQDNLKLGLVVTENINEPSFAYVKDETMFSNELIPVSSITNPLSTVLYGTTAVSGAEEKKMKLEIFYTQPN